MGAVEVLEAMKQMSVDAQNSQKPVIVLFGQVLSVKPLQIKVNQKQTIKEDALILTHAVKDYEVDIEGKDPSDVAHDFLVSKHLI